MFFRVMVETYPYMRDGSRDLEYEEKKERIRKKLPEINILIREIANGRE